MVGEHVDLDELSGGELLDHVEALAATQRRCEVEILLAAVQHAYLHDADTLDPEDSGRAGRERARRMGGCGTPEVSEFAAAELGARLGMSTVSAGMLIADGLDLAHRLPLVWARVQAGEARVYLARLVARKTRQLSAAQAGWVDGRVADYVDGRLTWTRFQGLVEGLVAAADPTLPSTLVVGAAATAEREQLAASRQLARPTHRDTDGDTVEEEPKVDWATLLPHVVVYVHLYGRTDGEQIPPGIARVEECGPMSLTWLRDHLSPHAKVTIRPVLDIAGQAPVDAYEIPPRHRQAVRLMTPADTFPYSTSLHPDQIDHTEPYRHGSAAVGAAQSRLGNYGPLSTSHHRLKTFSAWTVRQPFPGIYLWRDPHGAIYLVDHTGTRPLHRNQAA